MPHAGEHRDDRRVPPLLEAAARARALQARQFLAGEDRDGLVGDVRRAAARPSGRAVSSSAASHLKNCCSARYWLLA